MVSTAVMRQMLGEEQYLTACYACLNRQTRRLAVISAGHPPLILVTGSGEAKLIEVESEPLGVFSTAVLQRREIRVSRGDRFFLYTDGLIESSPGGGRRGGLERLVETCVRHRAVALKNAAATVVSELWPKLDTVGDDLLLLAVEVGL